MKSLLILLLVFGTAGSLFGQDISKTDRKIIQSNIDDWNRAWKIKDPVLAAKWYSQEAHFTNAFGFKRIGQAEIEKYLTEVFDMPFVMAGNSRQRSLILQIVGKKAVMAISTVERIGQEMPDGSKLEPRKTTHHRLFRKVRSEWKIISHLISDARSTQKRDH